MNFLDIHRHRIKHGLPYQAEVLLAIVADHGPLTVMQLLETGMKEQVGSQATLHGNISDLRNAGLVNSKRSKKDHRILILDLSKKGTKYLREVL